MTQAQDPDAAIWDAIAGVINEADISFCEHEEHWSNLRLALANDPKVQVMVLRAFDMQFCIREEANLPAFIANLESGQVRLEVRE